MGTANDAVSIAALTEALQGLSSNNRKPTLPAFDQKNVELWIRRVDAAYTRASVNNPAKKFAYLEEKLGVDLDPKINEFLFDDSPTEATWTAFKVYLTKTFGKTTRSKASTILDGMKREGRKPSQLRAAIKDRAGDVTVDMLIKEMIIRELPTSIQRVILDKSKHMDSEETAELADQYFEKDGRQIHKESTSVNSLETPFYTTAFAEGGQEDDVSVMDPEPESINAIRGRYSNQKRPSFNNDKRQGRSRSRPSSNRQGGGGGNGPRLNDRPTNNDGGLCRNHLKFGEKTFNCLPGCARYQAKTPNGQPPRRT